MRGTVFREPFLGEWGSVFLQHLGSGYLSVKGGSVRIGCANREGLPSTTPKGRAAGSKTRKDLPGRQPYGRGCLPTAMSAEEKETASKALVDDFYAASAAPSVAAKWKTVEKALLLYDFSPFPPSPQKVLALGAVLKAGGYRSAETYLQAYRTAADRAECPFGGPEVRALRDATRSCKRGLGGPVRALPLPFERLGEDVLPNSEAPWSSKGPLGPKNAVILGAWFLMREAELSGARACNIQVVLRGAAPPLVQWSLPASKSDQAALGVARTHGCCCSSVPLRRCPVHSAWDQLLILEEKFPSSFKTRGNDDKEVPPVCVDEGLPLFPAVDGSTCAKEAVTETIVQAAKFLAVPLEVPDQSERVSGHSLRATGAQGLARAGLELWAIQLMGRWGSDAVKLYVRDAFIEASEGWARKVVGQTDLSELVSGPAPVFPDVRPQLVDKDAPCHEALRPAFEHAAAAASSNHRDLEEQVVVSSTGIVHKVLFGPPLVELVNSTSVCGWSFGGGRARLGGAELIPNDHKALCARCFPEKRRLLKEDLERRARRQVGEA